MKNLKVNLVIFSLLVFSNKCANSLNEKNVAVDNQDGKAALPKHLSDIFKQIDELEDLTNDRPPKHLIETFKEIDEVQIDFLNSLQDENEGDEFCEWQKCDNDLSSPRGIRKYLDVRFLKKFVRNLSPFSSPRMVMRFFLFKREFPDCGRELTEQTLLTSGFNASLPTRILIHGWMSQSRGSFNRDIKNAYLKKGDFNIIITDWSASSSNANYFSVVKMIEGFGAQLARFTNSLTKRLYANYDNIYLVGHSLGAQIAGAAGKLVKPQKYNTIFALDPAGPKFRERGIDFRIDPTDAKYVESIQTSANLGLIEPTGNATFYPNYGFYQRKCYYVGCSHIRAYKMFAESITSELGFYGKRCTRNERDWKCEDNDPVDYRMGGEPSVVKTGIFYVDTAAGEPFALGKLNRTKTN